MGETGKRTMGLTTKLNEENPKATYEQQFMPVFLDIVKNDPAVRERAFREVFTEMWEKGVITASTDPKDVRVLIRSFLKGQ
jgi:hypothetical protein